MEALIKLMLGGGLFATLGIIHWAIDWIFQSHKEAMVKHNNARVRAKHCLIYTLGFVPLLIWIWIWSVGGLLIWQLVASLLILFLSHFYLDTYHAVYLWAKYIRRPPEMTEPYMQTPLPDPKAGFVLFVQGTLGKILMISIDQLTHLICLWPIVWFVISNIHIDASIFSGVVSCNYPVVK